MRHVLSTSISYDFSKQSSCLIATIQASIKIENIAAHDPWKGLASLAMVYETGV